MSYVQQYDRLVNQQDKLIPHRANIPGYLEWKAKGRAGRLRDAARGGAAGGRREKLGHRRQRAAHPNAAAPSTWIGFLSPVGQKANWRGLYCPFGGAPDGAAAARRYPDHTSSNC